MGSIVMCSSFKSDNGSVLPLVLLRFGHNALVDVVITPYPALVLLVSDKLYA